MTNCHRLKLPAEDGKLRKTDCANTKTILRIIQAEPFKRWLAHVGYERIREIEDYKLAQECMKEIYEQKGYSKSWMDKRLRGIAVRQDLTDEWQKDAASFEEEKTIANTISKEVYLEGVEA